MVGHPGAAAPHPGLNLVNDEQGTCGAGELTRLGDIALGQLAHPCLALDGLDDERSDVRSHRRRQRLYVAGRDELDPTGQRLKGLAVGGLVGQCQRPHGAAVEGLLQRQHAWAGRPAVAAGDLEGSLVRLRTRVRQEDTCLLRRAGGEDDPCQLLGQADLRGRGEDVGHVPKGGQLLGDGCHDGWVGVPQAVDGNTCQQVGVGPAVGVRDLGAGATDEHALGRAEGVHHRTGVALGPVLLAASNVLSLAHKDIPPLVRETAECSG